MQVLAMTSTLSILLSIERTGMWLFWYTYCRYTWLGWLREFFVLERHIFYVNSESFIGELWHVRWNNLFLRNIFSTSLRIIVISSSISMNENRKWSLSLHFQRISLNRTCLFMQVMIPIKNGRYDRT